MSCRPDFMILIYPVITMGPKGHAAAAPTSWARRRRAEMITQSSPMRPRSMSRTPPAFLAHASDDKVVSAG
jgi:hypothetical protein